MLTKTARHISSTDDNAGFHVFFECVSSKVRAGQECRIAVSDSHLCVNPSFDKRIGSVSPDIQRRRRNTASHRRNGIDGQAPAMAGGCLQQYSGVNSASDCGIQCIDYRGDIICNKTDKKEVSLGTMNQIQKYLLCSAGGDEGGRWARPNQFDAVIALYLLPGKSCTDQDPSQQIA